MSDLSERAGRNAIEVSGLSKSYGSHLVLDSVDLVVPFGQFVALSGPSGSGKSTLLHLLGALDEADSGTITVDGITLQHHRHGSLGKFRRDHVGIVFQLHNLIPRLTASQNIELAMFGSRRPRSERVERACELLERVDLEGKVNRKPPTLSGGERARVALARGMANDPPVLLADEPTGSLDHVSALAVVSQLRALARDDGVAVLAVSHDPRLNSAADRLLKLDDGKLTEVTQTPVAGRRADPDQPSS